MRKVTSEFFGLNAKYSRLTAAEVGGVVANSLKLAGLTNPLKVALTVWVVEEPTESVVVATPIAFVVLCVGLTAPLPLLDVTAHVTITPGTARPSISTAVTLKTVGRGLLKNQFCRSPPVGTKSVGGPGGWVPPPLQPDAQRIPTSTPHRAHCRRVIPSSPREFTGI